jgi:hypothetical protein
MSDDLEFVELLRRLGFYQSQINAELAKGAKADKAKIAKALAAGREFAKDAAPYCHSRRPVRRRGGWRHSSPVQKRKSEHIWLADIRSVNREIEG